MDWWTYSPGGLCILAWSAPWKGLCWDTDGDLERGGPWFHRHNSAFLGVCKTSQATTTFEFLPCSDLHTPPCSCFEPRPEALVWELEGLRPCPAPSLSTYVTWDTSAALSDLRFLLIKWESCLFYLPSRYVCNLKNAHFSQGHGQKSS